MPNSVHRTIAGFIAGALAVAIFHQGMYLLMKQFGVPLPGAPWNMAPAASAYGMPTVLNQMFWGGLWGILFAFMVDHIPVGPTWLRGFVFGYCTDCNPGGGFAALTLEEILNDHVTPLGVPAWRGAMIGHRRPQFTLAEGIEVEINASAATIRMLEPGVV